jgi:hypothetical protein
MVDRSILCAEIDWMFIRDYDMDPTNAPNVLWPQLHTIETNINDFQLLREVISGRIAVGCPLRRLNLPSAMDVPRNEMTWLSHHLEVETLSHAEMLTTSNWASLLPLYF